MTLEELIQSLGCKTKVFKKNGELTKNGLKYYNHLTDLLSGVAALTNISTTKIVDTLDEICNNND